MKKKYSDDFKRQIINLLNEGKTPTFLSKQYQIERQLIYLWKNKFVQTKIPKEDLTADQKRIIELEKKLKNAELDNEILLKALAISGRKQ